MSRKRSCVARSCSRTPVGAGFSFKLAGVTRTDNAAWLFNLTHRGDPVEVTGTQRGLEDGNGWTDWNESYYQYKQASAL